MRDYSKVTPSFWTGSTGRALRGHPEAQLVALYLLTSPHTTMIGVFQCPLIYIAHETGLTLEGASKGLARLESAGFATFESGSDLVWVREMVRFQVGEDIKDRDNRTAGVRNQYKQIPSGLIKQGFYERYGSIFGLERPSSTPISTRPLQGASEPLVSQEQEREQEQEKEQENPRFARDTAISADPPLPDAAEPVVQKRSPAKRSAGDLSAEMLSDFDEWWQQYPRREAKAAARPAYARARHKASADELRLGAMRYAQTRSEQDPRYTKQPATWLNQECWTDEPDPERRPVPNGRDGLRRDSMSFADRAIAAALSYGEDGDQR